MPIITQFSPYNTYIHIGSYHSIRSLSMEKKKILSLFYNHILKIGMPFQSPFLKPLSSDIGMTFAVLFFR